MRQPLLSDYERSSLSSLMSDDDPFWIRLCKESKIAPLMDSLGPWKALALLCSICWSIVQVGLLPRPQGPKGLSDDYFSLTYPAPEPPGPGEGADAPGLQPGSAPRKVLNSTRQVQVWTMATGPVLSAQVHGEDGPEIHTAGPHCKV